MHLIALLLACSGSEDLTVGTDVSYGRIQYADATAEELAAAEAALTNPDTIARAAKAAPGLKEEFFEGDENAAVAWASAPGRVTVKNWGDAPQNTIEIQVHDANERPLKMLCDALLDVWLKEHWAEGSDSAYRYHLARPCSKWAENTSPPAPPEIPVTDTDVAAPAPEGTPTPP